MATNPKRLTADDLLEIPVPPGLRGYELVDGELVEMIPPGLPHGRIAARIGQHLLNHVDEHQVAGEVYVESGYVLGLPRDPERTRGPDVSFVSAATLQRAGGEPARGCGRFVPELVVEIDSPGRRPRVEQQRIQDWLEAGVRLLWVVHTQTRSVTVYQPDGSARVLRGDVVLGGGDILPGFTLPLRRLFPD